MSNLRQIFHVSMKEYFKIYFLKLIQLFSCHSKVFEFRMDFLLNSKLSYYIQIRCNGFFHYLSNTHLSIMIFRLMRREMCKIISLPFNSLAVRKMACNIIM